ncbi:MAG TPA: phosphate ABC transporter substrate-binding protein PstS [Thermoplasmata archaeon]|nr:phosphate ABC transporter substrate-binding protein PstS [Thermoplasmata archaeon]
MSATPPAGSTGPTIPAAESMPVVKRKGSGGILVAVVVVLIILVAGVAVAYEEKWFGSTKSSGTCGPLTLQGDGAQFVQPLVDAWASDYNSATGNQVNYPASGSGTGLTHFSEHPPLIDFAITDNPLSASEMAALPSAALTLPVIGGALAIVYNVPGVPTTSHIDLTGSVLAGIYLGLVTNWNSTAIASLNPTLHLPNASITTVHRSGSAGTSYVLSDFLSQDNATWASHVGKSLTPSWPTAPKQTGASSNALVLSTVESTADSIGYSDLTDYVILDSSAMGDAAIENPAHTFVVANLTNTATAIADKVASMPTLPTSTGNWYNVSMVNANGTNDYPLATFAYLYVYQNTGAGFSPSQEKSEVLVQWIDWLLTTGQAAASGPNLYYAALPASVLTIDQAGVSTMTYNSAAVQACG